MKLIKIGSGANCNIVLHSQYVSGNHAEMLLHDDGTITLEDKNSTNGTWVGNQKLTPNSPVSVKRGDLVKFGDTELQWHQVPVIPNAANYRIVCNIGSSQECDIVVSSQFAGRCHATLYVDKKGKATITDNDSRNGTEVNGTRLGKGKSKVIKRGDHVVVGDVDVTDQLRPYIPDPLAWLRKAAIGAAALAVAGLLVWLIVPIVNADKPLEGYTLNNAAKASVFVQGNYALYIEFEDCPIDADIWSETFGVGLDKRGWYPLEKFSAMSYSGTAFFLDREGRLGTNRHIAVPWEDVSEAEKHTWQAEMEITLKNFLPFEVLSPEHLEVYNQSASFNRFWGMIAMQGKRNYLASNDNKSATLFDFINAVFTRLHKSRTKIVGDINSFSIGYPDRNYTHYDELHRCTILSYSDTPDIDLALIQLNDKHTPDNITFVFNPMDYDVSRIEPQKEKLTWIGYPKGLLWGHDDKTHVLRPQVRETMCSSQPSKYDFDIQGEVVGGASGSPLFDTKTGRLVGVIYAHYVDGATYGKACQAKYLKEMYEKEVK